VKYATASSAGGRADVRAAFPRRCTAAASVVDGAFVIDQLPDEVRGVEVQAEVVARDRLEHVVPDRRGRGEVRPAGPLVPAEDHRAVLDRDAHAVVGVATALAAAGRPAGDLERLEAGRRRPLGDLGEREIGKGRRQEAQLHSGTSTHRRSCALRSTASAIRFSRCPSAKLGKSGSSGMPPSATAV
jgi:hypothetical protein